MNGYFLCDRGRFGAGFVNSEKRLDYPGIRRQDGRYDALTHQAAVQQLAATCRGKRMAAIGSPRASVEANYLLRELVGADYFCPGFSDGEHQLVNHALQLQRDSAALTPDLNTIESADAILILGEDLTNTAPRIALALRQSVRNKAYEMAADLRLETWQDAAIRNLAQEQRSPLYSACSGDTRLDDVAKDSWSLVPADITRLGLAIAAALAQETLTDIDSATAAHAADIAHALKNAQRPLVISGTGAGDIGVLDAAAAVASKLCDGGKSAMLCLAVPEVNSLGQAMLAGAASPTLEQLTQRAAAGEIDTLIVLENDLFRRMPAVDATSLLQSAQDVIALDLLDNRTTSSASLVLPAASFAESEGTLVSLEGRAQRHYPVFEPAHERHPSWRWLLACHKALGMPAGAQLFHFDDITRACAAQITLLGGITGAAPDHHFRNVGVKIPRQPHRYSGRTAMRANVSVHEPKQPVDDETPLAFTMEGLNRAQPGALLPYVWAPGWNSNQSLHRFQSEVGGPLRGGTAGMRLLGASSKTKLVDSQLPPAFQVTAGQWQLVARYQIYGSEELSALSPGLSELVKPGYIEIRGADALLLGVVDGDGINVGDAAVLEVKVNDHMAPGCAGYSSGHSGTEDLTSGTSVVLQKAAGWKRRSPQIIGSDGGAGGQHD